MCEYIVNYEDCYKYKRSSNKEILMKCPYCGNEKKYKIYNLYKFKKLPCICSDGKSYPEKFIYSLLTQLYDKKIIRKFCSQKRFDFDKEKYYDFYIELNNGDDLIIEAHGEQHYGYKNLDRIRYNGNAKTLREEQINDSYKCWIAYKNGINNYIQLDCRKSELGWIKNSIENSILNELFDLSDINWFECSRFSKTSIKIEVCKYWKDNYDKGITIEDVVDKFNLHRQTIRRYIKYGNDCGLCIYDPNKEHTKSGAKAGKKKRLSILMYDKEMNFMGEYESATWIEKHSMELFGIKLLQGSISDVCNNKKPQYKGYIFKYAN